MKVNPTNDQIRKLIKHPTAGGFPSEGPANWPDDQFTNRLLQDESISVHEERETRKASPSSESEAEPRSTSRHKSS